MKNSVKSVIIVGVGGQGTLLASRVLGSAMMSQGVDVKVSEVHGMSQRGGSVVTYVRYGVTPEDKVYSPVIEPGEADVVLAFEALEAARFLPYLKEGGAVVVNTQQMDPDACGHGNCQVPRGYFGKDREERGPHDLFGRPEASGRGRLGKGRERGADRRYGPAAAAP